MHATTHCSFFEVTRSPELRSRTEFLQEKLYIFCVGYLLFSSKFFFMILYYYGLLAILYLLVLIQFPLKTVVN